MHLKLVMPAEQAFYVMQGVRPLPFIGQNFLWGRQGNELGLRMLSHALAWLELERIERAKISH